MKGPTKKITVRLSAEAVAALEKFQAEYPTRSISEFTNGAVLYLAKQAWICGLDADCEPLGCPAPLRDRMRAIVAEQVDALCAERGMEKNRPRLVLV